MTTGRIRRVSGVMNKQNYGVWYSGKKSAQEENFLITGIRIFGVLLR